MALKIRLRQQGRTNRQTYRLVVTDVREPRGGKYIEMLGWYDPFQEQNNAVIDAERMNYWLGLGAQLTSNAESLISRIAPESLKDYKAKRVEKRTKQTAKRRALRKKA